MTEKSLDKQKPMSDIWHFLTNISNQFTALADYQENREIEKAIACKLMLDKNLKEYHRLMDDLTENEAK